MTWEKSLDECPCVSFTDANGRPRMGRRIYIDDDAEIVLDQHRNAVCFVDVGACKLEPKRDDEGNPR